MKLNWLKVVGAVVLIFFIVRGISALADGDVRPTLLPRSLPWA